MYIQTSSPRNLLAKSGLRHLIEQVGVFLLGFTRGNAPVFYHFFGKKV
jgi:hypothetical protein